MTPRRHQKSTGKEIKTLRRKMHLNRLYPARAGSWLNYSGGLTTPGCDEVVDWVVVPELLEISKIQVGGKFSIEYFGHGLNKITVSVFT